MSSLIDKGTIVERIDDLFFDHYFDNYPNPSKDLEKFYKEVLKIVINAEPQNKWISVKNKLPDKDGKYLVCGKVALSDIHGEPIRLVRFTERKEWLTSLSVKYWTYLPDVPESEGIE